MSSVRGMILQWGSTIKVSIEHRRDITEKLLKATLNPKQQQQQFFLQDPPVFYQDKKEQI